MSTFILIENAGEAFIESFTTLGVSTARGDDSKIGQFGSGAKMAVLQLLRNGTAPIIYSGTTKLEFMTEPAKMGNKLYNKTLAVIGGKERELGFALEYGEMDWTTPWMALREFLSNAIDASSFDDVRLSLEEKVRAKSGYTRVYVPCNPSTMEAFNQLSDRFLHFTYQDKNSIIEKEVVGPCKVYRRGVFIRELRQASLFDYNLDIPVDECRNCEEWTCEYYIKANLSRLSKEQWVKVLGSTDSLEVKCDARTYPNLVEAYLEKFGDRPCTTSLTYTLVQHKDTFVVLPDNLVSALEFNGIRTATSFLNKLEREGNLIVEATPKMHETLHKVSVFLNMMGYNFEKPTIKGFRCTQNNGVLTMGYVENDTIYINVDCEGSESTMLEELAHYLTGASDGTRDFQTFAFDIAARTMEYFV